MSLVNGEYVPDTDAVRRRYVEAVVANRLATREEAEAEFDRWFKEVDDAATARGFDSGLQSALNCF